MLRLCDIGRGLFQNSLLFRYWSKLGIEFVSADNVSLRYDQHTNGDELTVLYAIERDWSKYLFTQKEGKVLETEWRKPFRSSGRQSFYMPRIKAMTYLRM